MPAKNGSAKQAVRGVDFALIHPCGDNGTVLHEEELMGRNREEEGTLLRVRIHGNGRGVISESHLPPARDFRHGIDEGECQCDGGTVCLQCTARDLADVPKLYLEHIEIQNPCPNIVGGVLEQVFDVLMPRRIAENIGFVPETS